MAVFYLDSSALVKRYVREAGTAWVRQWTDPEAEHILYVAHIAGAEVVAALTRLHRTGALTPAQAQRAIHAFRREFGYLYHVAALTDAVVHRAMDLAEAYPLRGYDAVQLATAVRLQDRRAEAGLETPTFVSADQRLNEAATSEGFTVEDPTHADS